MMNKPAVSDKSFLLLACLCNALNSVLLTRPGRVAAVLALLHHIIVLAWCRLRSKQVCHSATTALALAMKALTSLSQLTCCSQEIFSSPASCAQHAGSHTCTPTVCAWDDSLVFPLASKGKTSGKHHCSAAGLLLIKCAFSPSQQLPFCSIRPLSIR